MIILLLDSNSFTSGRRGYVMNRYLYSDWVSWLFRKVEKVENVSVF